MESSQNQENQENEGGNKNVELNWPPLESDPQIFNDYFHSLGLKKTAGFCEMISLTDYKDFLIIKGPLLGIIMNFSKGENKEEIDESKFVEENSVPYYMKQTEVLDNACGLIASLHAFGNSNLEYEKDSILDKFFNGAKGLNAIQRAELLEKSEEFKKVHTNFSELGQTDVKKELENNNCGHYICFINLNDKIYELDGCKKSPLILKEGVNSATFVGEVSKIILERINKKYIKDQVSVMLIYDEKSELTNLLEYLDE